jgi:hypothetical protein
MLGLDLWPLYLIAACASLLGLVLLLLPVRGTLRWMRTRGAADPEKRAKRPSMTTVGVEVLAGITCLSLAVAAVSLVAAVASYQALAEKTLCAEVRAEPHPTNKQQIVLNYAPVIDGRARAGTPYVINGNMWGVEGHVLRWDDWVRVLGMKTCFKVTRISGKYSPPVPGKHSHPVYLGGEDDWLWKKLRANDHKLPGVEASWHSSAHRGAVPGAVFEIYATAGGYFIKRKK